MTAPSDGWALRCLRRPRMDTSGHNGCRSVPLPRRALTAMISLGVTIGAISAAMPYSVAGADNTTNLKQRALVIAQQITSDNAHIVTISSIYLAQSAQYVLTREEVYATQIKIHGDQRAVSRDRHQVQTAMVDAYVAGGSRSSAIFGWSSNPDTLISSSTYLGVATNQLDSSVTRFENDVRVLKGLLLKEQLATTREGAAAAASAAARSQVLTTVHNEQALYNSTNSQLNSLVAAAAAAAAAEAAAAAAAATARAQAAAGPPTPTALATVTIAASPPGSVAASFAAIRNCESSGDYSLNTGNGYYGAYQFALATWQGLGESGLPSEAPAATQDAAAVLLYQRSGNSFAAWGTCAAITGVR